MNHYEIIEFGRGGLDIGYNGKDFAVMIEDEIVVKCKTLEHAQIYCDLDDGDEPNWNLYY